MNRFDPSITDDELGRLAGRILRPSPLADPDDFVRRCLAAHASLPVPPPAAAEPIRDGRRADAREVLGDENKGVSHGAPAEFSRNATSRTVVGRERTGGSVSGTVPAVASLLCATVALFLRPYGALSIPGLLVATAVLIRRMPDQANRGRVLKALAAFGAVANIAAALAWAVRAEAVRPPVEVAIGQGPEVIAPEIDPDAWKEFKETFALIHEAEGGIQRIEAVLKKGPNLTTEDRAVFDREMSLLRVRVKTIQIQNTANARLLGLLDDRPTVPGREIDSQQYLEALNQELAITPSDVGPARPIASKKEVPLRLGRQRLTIKLGKNVLFDGDIEMPAPATVVCSIIRSRNSNDPALAITPVFAQ